MTDRTEPRNLTPADQPRLWFGFAGSAAAWVVLFIADLLLVWKMCIELPNGFDLLSLSWAIYLFAAVTVLLLAVTIAAGLVSFGNFRRFSHNASLARTEATGREEFMALGGIFISVTMSFGIIWLGIPPIILHLCTRAR
jgi:hypothetical protein